MSDIIPEGILYGNLGIGSGTTNYNDLDNKPQINAVTLQGNKTASELGLVGLSDIPVTSVNGETGAVVLDGTEIEFSTGVSLNEKIIAVEQEIPVIAYPVTSVNGETGAVVLDGTEINYQAGKTINQKIDEVEAEIPIVSYPVTSVNGETGTVVLDGDDIAYNSSLSVNQKINEIASYTLKVIEYTPTTNTVTITASAIGAICMVFVNRGLPDYDASLEFITGSSANNAPLVGKYRGSNLTVSKTSGTEFIITANAEISNSTIYLIAISGGWTISG